MTHNLEVYKKAINFIMNLEDALTEREVAELKEILEQARAALPPQLLESLQEIGLELAQALSSEEDSVADSYLRDL